MSYRNIPSDYYMIINVENKWFCSLISVKTVVVSKGMAPVDPECTAKQGVAHVFTQGKDIYDVMLNQVGTLSNIQFIQSIWNWHRWWYSIKWDIWEIWTFQMLKIEYSRSVPWLLMTWLLMSTGQQQLWYWLNTIAVVVYWLCRINRFVSYFWMDFIYLCHFSVEKQS